MQIDMKKIEKILEEHPDLDERYPEIRNLDTPDAKAFGRLYREIAQEIKESPDKFRAQIEESAMEPEEVSELLGRISDAIDHYPEIMESQENAQKLHPANLGLIWDALKEDVEGVFKGMKK